MTTHKDFNHFNHFNQLNHLHPIWTRLYELSEELFEMENA